MAAAGQRRLYRTWFPPDELTREEIVSQKCSLICVHLIAMFFTRKVSTTLQNCCIDHSSHAHINIMIQRADMFNVWAVLSLSTTFFLMELKR